jgi:hypothetical protein
MCRFRAFNNVLGVGPDHEKNSLLCFDAATGAQCPDSPYPVTFPLSWVGAGSVLSWIKEIDKKIYIFSPGRLNSTGRQFNVMTCFDPNALPGQELCPGKWPVAVPTSAGQSSGTNYGDIFPYRPVAEVDSGVCIGGSRQQNKTASFAYCFDLLGNPIGSLNTGSFEGVRWTGISGEIFGTKMLIPGGSGVYCIVSLTRCQLASVLDLTILPILQDMATNGSCRNYPALNLAPVSEIRDGAYRTYTIRKESPTCYWANGDGGNSRFSHFFFAKRTILIHFVLSLEL